MGRSRGSGPGGRLNPPAGARTGAGAPPCRVAYQGEPGAFSEEAARLLFGPAVETLPVHDFAGVGHAVEGGEAAAGLLPVENSLAGSVAGSYDVLADGTLSVFAAAVMPIRQCLLGVAGATLGGVRRVLSHPVALAQCRRFLAAHPHIEPVTAHDTAGAARIVAARADPATAAIAARGAAERYGLAVIAADVEDRPDNRTRFFAVARADGPLPPSGLAPRIAAGAPRRSLLLIETRRRSRALARLAAGLAEAGIAVTRLDPPTTGEPRRYRFFAEIDTAADTAAALRAIDAAGGASVTLRGLGSFPAATAGHARARPSRATHPSRQEV